MKGTTTAPSSAQFTLCCLSLSLSYAVVLSLSEGVYQAVGAAEWMRIASASFAGAALLALAIISTWRPALLGPSVLMSACGVLIAVGVVGIALGWNGVYSFALGAGLAGLFAAGSLTALVVKAACVSMDPNRIAACIVLSFLLGHAWSFLLSFLNPIATVAACVGITAAILVASSPYYRPLLARLSAAEAPHDLAAVRPGAFLPFGHQLFVYLALFNFAHGYLLSFATTGESTLGSLVTVVAVVLIGVALVIRKGRMFPDILFACAALLVVGGFLLAPIAEVQGDIAAAFLAPGVACFNLLYLYTLLIISAKNKANTIPVLAWSACVETVALLVGGGVGTAVLKLFATDHTMVSLLSIGIVLVILGCILFTIRSFSFDQTIERIEPESSLSLATSSATWEHRCREIADKASLTPREREVFALLARGRNSPYIQKELVITNNTVKAHVKHIYQKLGVSSHQELIDLVDGEGLPS